ncbi:MAG TPA: hypothetical protein DIW17_18750 [Clostridiales bacterium]|nr:hypothetical protein [Clostridiales bacterium]
MSSPPFDAEKYKALMSGLECSEVNFSAMGDHPDCRWDSEYHAVNIQKNSKLSYSKLRNLLVVSEYGLSKEMNENGVGVPIYRMNEIHNMLCDVNPSKYVDIERKQIEKYRLRDGDVLFNRTNSDQFVGRTGIFYSNDLNSRVFASYLVRFVPDKDKLLSEYLTAFLSSKYGQQEIHRRARPSINQTNVNPEEVKEIEIPLLSKHLQEKIAYCFRLANKLIIVSEKQYSLTQNILSHELALDNWQPSKEKISVRSVAEVEQAGRWDAEYYQPKYDEIKNLLRGFRRAQFSIDTENYTPKPDWEYVYLELGNILASGIISPDERQLGKELPTRARRLIHEGQVIMSSIEGSLESCALVTAEYDGAICSNGFFVMNSDDINPETLFVLMKSPVMQAQMKQLCSGSILAAVNVADMEDLYLPTVTFACQSKIKNLVTEMYACHHSSITLLNAAKRAVEIAIEEDENAALTYLSSQTDMFTDEEYSTDVSQPYLKVAESEVGDHANTDKGIETDERT